MMDLVPDVNIIREDSKNDDMRNKTLIIKKRVLTAFVVTSAFRMIPCALNVIY